MEIDEITQGMLAEYRDITRQMALLKLRERDLHNQFLAALRDGAPIEPGVFQLRTVEFEVRPITEDVVDQLLGEEVLVVLRSQVPPVRRLRVEVVDASVKRRPLRRKRWGQE